MSKLPIYVDLDNTLGAPVLSQSGEVTDFVIRPGAKKFLRALSKYGKVIILTHSQRNYAKKAIKKLGPTARVIKGLLSREDTYAAMPPGADFPQQVAEEGVLFDDMGEGSMRVALKRCLVGTYGKGPSWFIQVSFFSTVSPGTCGLERALLEFEGRI
jgi:hypothetical protein